jgi:hypothetical protein
MGNELTTKSNSYIATTEDYFATAAAEAAQFRDGGGVAFMKFDGNTGEYSYGANNEELPLGTLLALNIPSWRRGYICWNDGQVVGEVMVAVNEGQPPRKQDLEDHGPYVEKNDGWSDQYTIEMRMVDEPHLNLLFQANNGSKRRAFEHMMKDFARQYKSHPGCAPVVEIDETEFETKDPNGGKRKFKKHAPVFKIVDWVPLEELNALVEGSPDDYEQDDAPPARVTARRAAREEVEDDAPPARTATRRAAREEPEEEEERPVRASTRRAAREEPEEEEDERPAVRRSARAAVEEEPEEDAPRRNRAEPASRRGKF